MTLLPVYNCFMASSAGFSIINAMSLAEDIKQKAFQLGFDLVGVTDASSLDDEQVELII